MDTFQNFETRMKIQYHNMEFSRIQNGESCNLQIHKKIVPLGILICNFQDLPRFYASMYGVNMKKIWGGWCRSGWFGMNWLSLFVWTVCNGRMPSIILCLLTYGLQCFPFLMSHCWDYYTRLGNPPNLEFHVSGHWLFV